MRYKIIDYLKGEIKMEEEESLKSMLNKLLKTIGEYDREI